AMARLDGRRVLVVGASRGIGRAIGLACSLEGASVAFAARTRARLEAVVAECEGKAVAVECDVRDGPSARAAVATAVAAIGGLDTLVYAAGIMPFTELPQATVDEWRDVFETNVIGAGVVTAAAVDELRDAGGHAIYLSSESAQYRPEAWRGIGVYVASKRAL